jgi:cobalt/nickel transport system permease protein
VVLQTSLSGVSSLPLKTFLLFMLPIHAAIGVVEGLATAALIAFLRRARPDVLDDAASPSPARGASTRPLLTTLALAALLTGGVLSWFASTQPDGLDWSLTQAAGIGRTNAPAGPHAPVAWPDMNPETSLSGVVGGAATLALVMAAGLALRRRRAAAPRSAP